MQMYSSNKYKTIPNPCRLLPNSLRHHYLPQHLLGWAASLPNMTKEHRLTASLLPSV